MMMHDGPSGLLSSCDLRIVGSLKDGGISMVKQHPTDIYSYPNHHNQPIHHSESSRSSSISSSSLSPKTSSVTVASSTTTSTSTLNPVAGATTAFSDIDPKLAQDVEYELGLTKKNGGTGGTRKNAWGNLSYAELISKAITSSAEQRLTLSEIYDWMIKYVPFFRNKVDRVSSAGWKNSIRHNLSLHNRFKRVQSEGSGKSSWWMINPDEKLNGNSSSSTSTAGTKQSRRRLGQNGKSSASSSSSTPATKRLRTQKLTKSSKSSMSHAEQDSSTLNQSILTNEMPVTLFDTQPWANQSDAEMVSNHIYEQDLYSPSVNTPTTNSSINSVGCMPSAYTYDDVSTTYVTNGSSNNTNTNDYGYHHAHHYHHTHPQTLYQHHHSSNYDMNSNNGYYIPQQQQQQQQQQRLVLNDHSTNPRSLSIDTYHSTTNNSYSLQQQTAIDPNDEQSYLRVHSASSHSSSASLSPPTLSTNSNLVPSSSSGSSSSNYSHSHKSSTSGGYLHPTANGTLTLYSHHHQPHITHLSHSHQTEVGTFLQLNIHHDEIENDEDDDDLSTLVHHHDLIDDRQALPSFYSNTIEQRPQLHSHHLIHSNNDGSTSILRTVLHRPIVDMQNHQV